MRSAEETDRNGESEVNPRRLESRLATLPGVMVAADQGVRLVGLAADEDPELGFVGVPRDLAAMIKADRSSAHE